ncbi:MAG TPA: D-alanyl-D-alanine carboxypeptidase/D-alanyl-D-alanine-endopeptidase [Paucimonas sp.]|nr:D-alanyl-D-alanine carboxypeptidase/D-alanyl-D-alanine-endopeptidase [Paucimonas sp.]HJW56619.1 D-alanyl-D-alanine carboxypeptidase/D-alanyl-D-alanine-endopeptidase [Burkholderiaceae bacterium]
MRILKKSQVRCLMLLLAVLMQAAGVSARELPLPVARALRQAHLPVDALGIYVQDVSGRKALVAFNPDTPFSPASTMKLVTTNAALELLGPAFTWKTQAYADGVQSGDVLQGNLVIKGSGDPKLVTEKFWLFLRQIRARGVREITGDLVLDRSAFEEVAYDPAGFDGDPSKPYNAGADALLLNYETLRLRFAPDESQGMVNVTVDPPVADYPVAAPRLANGDCGDWQRKLDATLQDGIRFNGSFAIACNEKTWYVHPAHLTHTRYFGAVFRQMWADLGGVFRGSVRSGPTPSDARLITEWESATLPEVIRDINKYSNNVMARQLLLTIAASKLHLPGNTERGTDVVKSWLANKGIAAPELVIENGSGLSRIERIAPRTMARMLVAAFKSPVMPELMASMPVVGYDGTMRNRLRESGVAGNAHIKTGRLDDVRAVAGYVLAASGKRYAVVCLINHPNADSGLEVQDALLQWVYEFG